MMQLMQSKCNRSPKFGGRTLLNALAFGLSLSALPALAMPSLTVHERAQKNDFPLFTQGRSAHVLHDRSDAKVVGIAADLLRQDIARVTGADSEKGENGDELSAVDPSQAVIIGTLEQSALVREAVRNGKFDAAALRGQWESYKIAVVGNPLPQSHPEIKRALLIVGSDRRGAAYGTFTLSESIGVSPWVWWADVPSEQHADLFVAPQTLSQGPPAVKYRGIFINDEDFALKPWAAQTFDPQSGDIGPKTYAKIFELMLRLRANFCWPAMHPVTKAFNQFPTNKIVADDYAIVMGASHCEPMLHNNATEWNTKVDGEWNYETNAAGLQNVWDERLITNGQYENVYTVGMRGIHDSGMPGGGTLQEKARRLERVIADQRDILTRRTGQSTDQVPQIFCPYKEVLNIYRTGMNLPDDVTIVWADDNHGYLRQLSDAQERKRTGGSGVYYHFSYWGEPQDYLWISSTSPSLVSYEMTKAYNYGADKLWVFNVGDIKPAEKELTFAMELAWDIGRGTPENALDFPRQWAARTFGENLAQPIGQMLNEYYRLAQSGKPEHMNRVTFSPAERARRLADYRAIKAQAQAIYARIPARSKDAYYQLVYYPVTAAALMNEKFLLARDSLELAQRGDARALQVAADATRAYEEIERITRVYNEQISDGKWRGMMNWHPRNQSVFEMPPVATAAMIEAALAPSAIEIDLAAGALTQPMQVRDGVLVGTSPAVFRDEAGGSATYVFNAPEDSTLGATQTLTRTLWALAKTPSPDEDSWHINFNGQKTVVNDQITGNQWKWIRLGNFALQPGKNTLVIGQREPNARIKALRFGGDDPTAKSDALLTIAGAGWSRKTNGQSARIEALRGFGEGAATIAPVTAPSVEPAQSAQAPMVGYTVQLPAGERRASLRFLPTSAINVERGLRAAVRINGGPQQILDLNAQEYTKEWGDNVLRGFSKREIDFEQKAGQKTDVEVRFLDPGLVLKSIAFH